MPTDAKLAELMKRDRKLQAIMGQRELTRQITELQEEEQRGAE
jgi:hypothetical protein